MVEEENIQEDDHRTIVENSDGHGTGYFAGRDGTTV